MKLTQKQEADDLARIADLKIALKEALAERDTWKAAAETWRSAAKVHRSAIEGLRKELNETTDAYNELYDMVEHGST